MNRVTGGGFDHDGSSVLNEDELGPPNARAATEKIQILAPPVGTPWRVFARTAVDDSHPELPFTD